MQLNREAENKILEAARKIFEEKGYDGTRMQEIADEAEISKASLHYYFRSKDNLFEKVFTEALDAYIPLISTWEDDDLSWEEKTKNYTTKLLEFIKSGRMLFLIREINRNPDLISDRIKSAKSKNIFVKYFEELKEKKKIREDIDPRFLHVFLQSACCFPVMNQQMFQRSLKMTPKQFDEFMLNYATATAQFFINAIKK